MCGRSNEAVLRGGLSHLPPILLVFPSQFPLLMRLLYQVGRPGENVLAPVSENDQVLFLLKPQANSLFSTSLIAPDFDSRVSIVVDDRFGPADALQSRIM